MPDPAEAIYGGQPSSKLGNDRGSWGDLSDSERSALLSNADKILGNDPALHDPANLEEAIRDSETVRLSSTHPTVKKFLRNLPSDMEVFHINEFGEGHENNTSIIRVKKTPPPLTS